MPTSSSHEIINSSSKAAVQSSSLHRPFAFRRKLSLAIPTLRIATWIVWFSLIVKFLPLDRALRMLAPRLPFSFSMGLSPEEMARVIDRLLRINRLAFTPVCWKRAAMLYRGLALNGIETHIVFGVRPDEETLDGHAWLETVDGKPLLEANAASYTVTYRFPS